MTAHLELLRALQTGIKFVELIQFPFLGLSSIFRHTQPPLLNLISSLGFTEVIPVGICPGFDLSRIKTRHTDSDNEIQVLPLHALSISVTIMVVLLMPLHNPFIFTLTSAANEIVYFYMIQAGLVPLLERAVSCALP